MAEDDTPEKAESEIVWGSISVPRALIARVEAIFERVGYMSKSEYVRAALLKQLREDESHEG